MRLTDACGYFCGIKGLPFIGEFQGGGAGPADVFASAERGLIAPLHGNKLLRWVYVQVNQVWVEDSIQLVLGRFRNKKRLYNNSAYVFNIGILLGTDFECLWS